MPCKAATGEVATIKMMQCDSCHSVFGLMRQAKKFSKACVVNSHTPNEGFIVLEESIRNSLENNCKHVHLTAPNLVATSA